MGRVDFYLCFCLNALSSPTSFGMAVRRCRRRLSVWRPMRYANQLGREGSIAESDVRDETPSDVTTSAERTAAAPVFLLGDLVQISFPRLGTGALSLPPPPP